MREMENSCDDIVWKALDISVVLLSRRIEESASRGDLVFDVGELGLELEKACIRLQVRIALRQREDGLESAREHVVCGDLVVDGLGAHVLGARGGDIREGLALVRRIAFHRLDEIGDEVHAELELDIDVREGLIAAIAQSNNAIVHRDEEERDDDGDSDDDPSGHGDMI